MCWQNIRHVKGAILQISYWDCIHTSIASRYHVRFCHCIETSWPIMMTSCLVRTKGRLEKPQHFRRSHLRWRATGGFLHMPRSLFETRPQPIRPLNLTIDLDWVTGTLAADIRVQMRIYNNIDMCGEILRRISKRLTIADWEGVSSGLYRDAGASAKAKQMRGVSEESTSFLHSNEMIIKVCDPEVRLSHQRAWRAPRPKQQIPPTRMQSAQQSRRIRDSLSSSIERLVVS